MFAARWVAVQLTPLGGLPTEELNLAAYRRATFTISPATLVVKGVAELFSVMLVVLGHLALDVA